MTNKKCISDLERSCPTISIFLSLFFQISVLQTTLSVEIIWVLKIVAHPDFCHDELQQNFLSVG